MKTPCKLGSLLSVSKVWNQLRVKESSPPCNQFQNYLYPAPRQNSTLKNAPKKPTPRWSDTASLSPAHPTPLTRPRHLRLASPSAHIPHSEFNSPRLDPYQLLPGEPKLDFRNDTRKELIETNIPQTNASEPAIHNIQLATSYRSTASRTQLHHQDGNDAY